MLYFRFKPFKTKNIFLFISQHNCDSHSSLWIIISYFPILHVTIARRNYVRHRTGEEFLPLIKPLTKFSLTAAESTISHEIVWVTWALSATCSPLLGAQLPVVKDNSGMMQSGDLGRRPPCKELCENKPWEEGLFSLAWELCELSGSCLSNIVGMLFPGRHLTDLDLLTWFSGLTFNLPSHYRFAWQSLDRWLNLVAVTSPDSDPDTLTSFQITSHHFTLVLWSGLLGDPNSHNQTHPACLAQLRWGCALVSEDVAPDHLAVTINSQMSFPCAAAYSRCSLTSRISLPFISRLFFLFCLLPNFDTTDHSCLPGILHPRGLKISFFPPVLFKTVILVRLLVSLFTLSPLSHHSPGQCL